MMTSLHHMTLWWHYNAYMISSLTYLPQLVFNSPYPQKSSSFIDPHNQRRAWDLGMHTCSSSFFPDNSFIPWWFVYTTPWYGDMHWTYVQKGVTHSNATLLGGLCGFARDPALFFLLGYFFPSPIITSSSPPQHIYTSHFPCFSHMAFWQHSYGYKW